MKNLIYGKLKAVYFEVEESQKPLIFEIHGGGFCYGNEKSDVGLCERLRDEIGCNVVSIGYRLAPIHTYPAALNDCQNIFDAMMQDESLSFDRTKVYVMGHSAGGELAVALAQTRQGISRMVLDYPWLNIADNKRPYRNASIPKFVLDSFARKYCRDKGLRKEPLLSPLYMANEVAATMPKTFIITGGSDSLRVDGMAFQSLLHNAGVSVRHVEFDNARHGFIEECSSGRMKRNFYTTKKTVAEQYERYEQAIQNITEFIKENG